MSPLYNHCLYCSEQTQLGRTGTRLILCNIEGAGYYHHAPLQINTTYLELLAWNLFIGITACLLNECNSMKVEVNPDTTGWSNLEGFNNLM